MGIGFTDRIYIVVTTLTTAGYTAVVEPDIAPGLVRDMAVVTGCRSLHVIVRFTCGGNAVMAAFTGSGNDGVIKIDL
jgi:hypothetical protein